MLGLPPVQYLIGQCGILLICHLGQIPDALPLKWGVQYFECTVWQPCLVHSNDVQDYSHQVNFIYFWKHLIVYFQLTPEKYMTYYGATDELINRLLVEKLAENWRYPCQMKNCLYYWTWSKKLKHMAPFLTNCTWGVSKGVNIAAIICTATLLRNEDAAFRTVSYLVAQLKVSNSK